MKVNKLISLLSALILSINLIFPAVSIAVDSEVNNLENIITVGDLRLMQDYLLGEKTISKEQYTLFDVNGDGTTDVFDFIFMKQSFIENGMQIKHTAEVEQFIYSYTENMYGTEHTAVIHSVNELTSYLSPLFNSDIVQMYVNKYNSKFFNSNVLLLNSFMNPYGEKALISVDSVNCFDNCLNVLIDIDEPNNVESTESAMVIQVIIPKSDYVDMPVEWHFSSELPVPPVYDNKKLIDVKNILQNPELPTGCEVTSLTILLNHLGYPADKVTMARNYLPKLDFYWENGIYYGADFRTTFAGNPESEYSYGCYAPCITITADNYFKDNGFSAIACEITGTDFDSLLSDYIDNDMPLLIWITSSNLHESALTSIWTTPEGEQVQWRAYEHCVVLTGYDMDNQLIYAADPLYGSISYDYSTIRQRYNEMGRQAVYIQ